MGRFVSITRSYRSPAFTRRAASTVYDISLDKGRPKRFYPSPYSPSFANRNRRIESTAKKRRSRSRFEFARDQRNPRRSIVSVVSTRTRPLPGRPNFSSNVSPPTFHPLLALARLRPRTNSSARSRRAYGVGRPKTRRTGRTLVSLSGRRTENRFTEEEKKKRTPRHVAPTP